MTIQELEKMGFEHVSERNFKIILNESFCTFYIPEEISFLELFEEIHHTGYKECETYATSYIKNIFQGFKKNTID